LKSAEYSYSYILFTFFIFCKIYLLYIITFFKIFNKEKERKKKKEERKKVTKKRKKKEEERKKKK
jgi:cytochrome bd-type quinol oxidase subunit 1